METSIRTYLFHTHVHISPCLYMCMFQLDYSVLASCNLYIPIIIRLYVSVPRRLMYTHLWPHVQGSLFQYSYVSILLINTLIPCSYKPIESLDSTPLPNCALFNTVFIRTHSIHINTYSCVHVFTKTVLNKIKRINVNKWIWNKICIYACLEYAIKLKIYIYIYIYLSYTAVLQTTGPSWFLNIGLIKQSKHIWQYQCDINTKQNTRWYLCHISRKQITAVNCRFKTRGVPNSDAFPVHLELSKLSERGFLPCQDLPKRENVGLLCGANQTIALSPNPIMHKPT